MLTGAPCYLMPELLLIVFGAAGVYGHIQSMRSQEPAMQKACIAAHIKWSAEAVEILRDAPIQAVMTSIIAAAAKMLMNPIKMPKLKVPEGFKMGSEKTKDMHSKLGCVARLGLGIAQCHLGTENNGFYCGCKKNEAMRIVTKSALSGKKPQCVRWYRLVVRATQIAEAQKLKEQREWMEGWVKNCMVANASKATYSHKLVDANTWLHKIQKQPSFEWAKQPKRMLFTYDHKKADGTVNLICKSEFRAGVAVCNKGKQEAGLGLGCKGKLLFAGMYGTLQNSHLLYL